MPEKDASTHSWFMERRYFSLVIVLAFFLLAATAFYICHRHHTINTEQSLKEDRSDANLLSLVLGEHLNKIVSVMESYSSRRSLLQAVRDKNAEKAMLHLINLKKSNPDVDILVITDRQGTLWAAYPERPELLGQNLAYRDWYKGVSKEWKSNISDVVLRIVREKDLAVTMSVPIFDETGEVIGILVNTQRTISLSDLIKQVPLDPGQDITVTDRKGQIIYSSQHNVEKEISSYPFYPGIKKAMAAKNKTFAIDDPDFGGRTRYISFAPVVDIGWTVFVGRDKRSIFLSGYAYYIQVTAIAFLLFLSVILFLFYSRKQVMAQQFQEQLQAEKQIRIRDERYKSYIDITMQLAWTTNDKGEIVEYNPSFSKYTGRGYEEIKGFGWMEDIHPDDRDRTVQIWRKAVAEKSFYETEYRLRRYDGVYRNYLARSMPLLAEDGSVREWVGTCIDITEVKRITAVMEENALKYEALFENQLNGLAYCKIVVDENNRPVDYIFLEINNAFEEHTGLKKKDVLDRRITEIIPGFEKSTFDFIGVHGRVALTGEAVRFEQYQEGLQRWYSVFVYSPKEGYFVSIFSDITERKQHDNEIKELGLRIQRILNAAGEGIYGLNVDGQITFINPAAAKMLGYDNQELIGKGSHDTFHHTRSDGSPFKGEDCPIYKSFKEGIAHYQDNDIFIRKDGTILPVEYTSSPIMDNGKVIGGVVAFRDITERKKAEETLQESEQRFLAVLRSSNDAILLIDGEKFVDCNEATARMLGYPTRDEFLKTHPSELSPPTQPDGRSSFEKAEEMMRIAFERGFNQFEWEHRRASGENFPVEVSLTSIVLHRKNVLHCVWRDLTEKKRVEEELQRTLDSLRKAVNTTIQVMVSAIEVRDPYTAGHQIRVTNLARAIATEMGLSQDSIEAIRMAGPIHDIGKLSVPAEILSKPTKLTNIEFALIKEHVRTGYEMLKNVESPWPLAEIVYQHHERMNGSGYPRSLKGDEILMEARILTVADVVEAMASHRPYRPGLGINAALNEIEKNRGIFYDNAVADACLRLFRKKSFQLDGI
jgi:PAS domain S-box-containing protein/putative nucleotidyltransferase with HDIG domain